MMSTNIKRRCHAMGSTLNSVKCIWNDSRPRSIHYHFCAVSKQHLVYYCPSFALFVFQPMWCVVDNVFYPSSWVSDAECY